MFLNFMTENWGHGAGVFWKFDEAALESGGLAGWFGPCTGEWGFQ